MGEIIEFIKNDKNLKTKMDKICFVVGYVHNSEDITKEQLIDLLEKIIFSEI